MFLLLLIITVCLAITTVVLLAGIIVCLRQLRNRDQDLDDEPEFQCAYPDAKGRLVNTFFHCE